MVVFYIYYIHRGMARLLLINIFFALKGSKFFMIISINVTAMFIDD